jgi:hypothetical protein
MEPIEKKERIYFWAIYITFLGLLLVMAMF